MCDRFLYSYKIDEESWKEKWH